MNKFLLGVLVVFLLGGLNSCYYDSEEDLYPLSFNATCDTTNITYNAVVKPIFDVNCSYSGCHAEVGSAAGINLATHAGITAYSSANLLSSINHDGNASPMPKNGSKLSDCDIQKITTWIQNGSPNN